MSDKRPKTRAECEKGPRPCPWVSCKYSTFFDIPHSDGRKRLTVLKETSTLKLDELAEGWLESWESAPYSCVLDAADDGPMQESEPIAEVLGIDTKNVNKIYFRARSEVERRVCMEERKENERLRDHRQDHRDASGSKRG